MIIFTIYTVSYRTGIFKTAGPLSFTVSSAPGLEELKSNDYAADIAFEHGKPQRKGWNQALDTAIHLITNQK